MAEDVGHLHELSRPAYLALVILGALSIAFLSWWNNDQGKQIRDQQTHVTMLAQALCVNLSESRSASNREIRQPLRQSVRLLSNILRQAAAKQQDPAIRQATLDLADKFDGYAGHVKNVPPLKCRFR